MGAISTLVLKSVLGNELVVQNICEILDLDYDEIKSKLPKDNLNEAEAALDGVTIDEQTTETGPSEPAAE